MSDLIDRLKAIDAIDGALLDEVIEGIVIDILLDLPSAQPDKTYEQGWKDGREALRKEMWEDGRDRLD